MDVKVKIRESKTTHLRHAMAGQSQGARVLAITSGKGGVGKTNISANLSICLAASNKKVVVVDADFGLGNIDVVMNISSRYNIRHVMQGQKRLDEITHIGPGGVEVICGGSGFQELANMSQFERQRLIGELDSLQGNCDIIIIDTSAGIHASVLGFCQAADHTLVVTTPEPAAMTDAYAMIKVLSKQQYPGRISLIVNMADSIAEGKKVYRQIADVAKRFLNVDVYEAGVLYADERLCDAVRTREPVVLSHPKSKISSSLVAMAARLSKGGVIKADRKGYFKKVVNWFF